MTKHESKLLSQWPDHQRRGKSLFVLLHGMSPVTIGILIGLLLYCVLSPRHSVYWGGAIVMLAAGFVGGGIRGVLLWDKVESFYANSQKH
jgi:hypothetical protein